MNKQDEWIEKWLLSRFGEGTRFEHFNRQFCKDLINDYAKQHLDSPRIVCLCGSTRFKDEFTDAQLRETLKGHIVLTIGCNMRSDTEIFGHLSSEEFEATKKKLDELHLRKIDLADEVMILNVGGYIGESTRREINYAKKLGKPIKYLEETDRRLK